MGPKILTRPESTRTLKSPDFTQRFLVQVNASATGLGAFLVQGNQGNERPVVYLSHKLLPRDTHYSAVEKECLAIKWALESLQYYFLGREFDLETGWFGSDLGFSDLSGLVKTSMTDFSLVAYAGLHVHNRW